MLPAFRLLQLIPRMQGLSEVVQRHGQGFSQASQHAQWSCILILLPVAGALF